MHHNNLFYAPRMLLAIHLLLRRLRLQRLLLPMVFVITSHHDDSVAVSAQCRHGCCQPLQLSLLLRQLRLKVLARLLTLLRFKAPAAGIN
jgi:hypothetical protein